MSEQQRPLLKADTVEIIPILDEELTDTIDTAEDSKAIELHESTEVQELTLQGTINRLNDVLTETQKNYPYRFRSPEHETGQEHTLDAPSGTPLPESFSHDGESRLFNLSRFSRQEGTLPDGGKWSELTLSLAVSGFFDGEYQKADRTYHFVLEDGKTISDKDIQANEHVRYVPRYVDDEESIVSREIKLDEAGLAELDQIATVLELGINRPTPVGTMGMLAVETA